MQRFAPPVRNRAVPALICLAACMAIPALAQQATPLPPLNLSLPADVVKTPAPGITAPPPGALAKTAAAHDCGTGTACTVGAAAQVYATFHDGRVLHQAQCAGINTSDLCRKWR